MWPKELGSEVGDRKEKSSVGQMMLSALTHKIQQKMEMLCRDGQE